MKLFIILALLVVSASAGPVQQPEGPVHPRDLQLIMAHPNGRITNADAAREAQFPYQVGLSFTASGGGWWCGGSLIDCNWILTDAHCTSGASAGTIFLGATKRTSAKTNRRVNKSNFIQHSAYNSLTLRNDISLIIIASVSYTPHINKVALPKASSSSAAYSGQKAIASGWGLVSDSASSVSPTLQYASLQVIDNTVCAKTYGSLSVTSKTICTATPAGTSTCSGDSGGPLVMESSGVLAGVTSFVSSAGCQSGAPAGFVRVTSYLDWIKANSGISY
ncbi:serine protease 1-like [Eurosta solidaginis]|uniref:serine protease 1-like n=1 Tax=Eurosta solidaginis TaxID=178769 RepID=UPI0035317650